METSVLAFLLFCVTGFVFYRFTFNPPSDGFIETELKLYWVEQGFKDVEVFKLTVSE